MLGLFVFSSLLLNPLKCISLIQIDVRWINLHWLRYYYYQFCPTTLCLFSKVQWGQILQLLGMLEQCWQQFWIALEVFPLVFISLWMHVWRCSEQLNMYQNLAMASGSSSLSMVKTAESLSQATTNLLSDCLDGMVP